MRKLRRGMVGALLTVTAVAGQGSSEGAQPTRPLYIGGAATPTEEAQFNRLLEQAHATLLSDAFRSNLLALASDYPSIFLRLESQGSRLVPVYGAATDLVAMVRSEQNFRFVRSPAALVGHNNWFVAEVWSHGDDVSGSMLIGRGNLGNWTSANVVTQSCAVNSVAHEMTHLISSDASRFTTETQPISDKGAGLNSGANPVASYLVGTAAQCTWLQQQNHIPAVDFRSCVKVFGHRGFNGGRCTQFAPGQAVEVRPGLFQEHVIQD